MLQSRADKMGQPPGTLIHIGEQKATELVCQMIATIFIPLTFITSVYGMNFRNMPELAWRWGYFFIWAIIAATALVMLVYFRRRRWL